jgi:hypothetical protein
MPDRDQTTAFPGQTVSRRSRSARSPIH